MKRVEDGIVSIQGSGEAPGLRDHWSSAWSGRRRAWEHNYTLNEGFLLLE